MTFIVSAATANIALQVADTRVTNAADGSIIDDASIKMTIVQCHDAKLIVSFTGLAKIDNVNTGQWITTKLRDFKSWQKVFQETMDFLRDQATESLSRNASLGKYGLEISAIGLGLSPAGVRQPAIAIITNRSEPVAKQNHFSVVDSRGRPFARYILSPEKIRHYVAIDGAIGAPKTQISGIRKRLQKQLREIRDRDDPRKILDRSVAMLRLHRQKPQLSHIIGNNCTAAAISGDFSVISGSYGERGKALLTPNYVRDPNHTDTASEI